MRTEKDIQRSIDYFKNMVVSYIDNLDAAEKELEEVKKANQKTYKVGDWFRRPDGSYYVLTVHILDKPYVGLVHMFGGTAFGFVEVKDIRKITQREFEQMYLKNVGAPEPCPVPKCFL